MLAIETSSVGTGLAGSRRRVAVRQRATETSSWEDGPRGSRRRVAVRQSASFPTVSKLAELPPGEYELELAGRPGGLSAVGRQGDPDQGPEADRLDLGGSTQKPSHEITEVHRFEGHTSTVESAGLFTRWSPVPVRQRRRDRFVCGTWKPAKRFGSSRETRNAVRSVGVFPGRPAGLSSAR